MLPYLSEGYMLIRKKIKIKHIFLHIFSSGLWSFGFERLVFVLRAGCDRFAGSLPLTRMKLLTARSVDHPE